MSVDGYSISNRLRPLGSPPVAVDIRPAGPAGPDAPVGPSSPPAADISTAAAGTGALGRLDRGRLNQLKMHVQRLLVDVINPGAELAAGGGHLRGMVEAYLDQVLAEQGIALSRSERTRVFERGAAEPLACGPIEPFRHDETIAEVMVNGPSQVWIERNGMIEETDVHFEDDNHVRRIIERIIAPLGRRCDEGSPMVDARLPDGSRVNAIIPPLSLVGPILTIRKFSKRALTAQNLVEYGTITPEVADFLAACVKGRANTLISAGTGSGKTTTLNVLSAFIPDRERIVTIEDAAELRLNQRHVIPLEARPANLEGAGAVPIRQLLVNALRMRPDRIVVGECRSAEALDMLQAMNTGHDGSMSTGHANTPRDMLSRLETIVIMCGMALQLRVIIYQFSTAVVIIAHQHHLT